MTPYFRMVTISAILFVALAAVIASGGTASAATYSITKTTSGLVASDSLTTGNTSGWKFGGTASSYNSYEDSQGLHLGVTSPKSGQWSNYYAETSPSSAQLFHATETIPYTSVPDGVFNIGLYVEGSNYIPHVGCEAYADSTGYYWVVEQSSDAGQTYTDLYITKPNALPQTQDCILITNGTNYLKVYIGGNMVYSSNSLNLGMSTPYHVFFQDDTSSNSTHSATYSNFYEAGENVKVTNNPANAATVQIVDSSGNVLASSSVSGGTATLNVAKYNFPLSGTINVYDSSNSLIASGSASIYGGDVFSVTGSTSAPQPPTGLEATAASSSQINLSWTAPSNNGGSVITGYKIERSTDGGSTWSTIQSNTGSTSTTYSDTGLAASTAYTYRVSAINSVGTSSPSGTATATTLASTGGTTGSIVLNDIQSTSGTVSSSPYQITLANVNAGTGSNRVLVVGVEANNNNVASVTFGGIPLTKKVSSFNNNDAEFWYLVNPTGTGNVVVTMTGSTSVVVGAYSFSGVDPTNPIPTKATNHNSASSSPTVSITTANPNSWVLDLPAIYGGKTLSSPTCTQEWDINVPSAVTGASSYAIQSSPGSVTCNWTASGGDFWDDIAIEVKASGTSSNTVPGSPTGLEATAASSSQINLSWTAPSNNGGSAIAGYEIDRSADAGSTWSTVVSNTASTSTTYSDTGLSPNTAYTYRVSAINAVGTSSPSSTASATTSSSTSHLTVKSQDYAGNSLSGFYVALSQNGAQLGTGYTPYAFTLNNGQTYVVHVDTKYGQYAFSHWLDTGSTSYNRTISISSNSTIMAVYGTVTQPPTNLAATTVSSSQIDLSWTAPTNTGGFAVSGYKIERSTDSGSTWSTIVANTASTNTAYSDIGLSSSTTYTYRVSALDPAGPSSPSGAASAMTSGSITAPQPPTNLAATAVSSSEIDLSWTAPANNGGAPITGYKIDRSTDGGSTWSTLVSNTASSSTTYSDTGLAASTTYIYRVSAINSAGTSLPSNTASAVTSNTVHTISLVQSGLVASDLLNNETKTQQELQANPGYWKYYGDAPNENATYDFFRDTLGLHIGVKAPSDGTYAGFYAESPNHSTHLWHAIISTPVRTLPAQNVYYENGLYVQTYNGSINYVSCFSDTSQYGTAWAIGYVTGNQSQGTKFKVLWSDTSANQPLTRDCTLVTNGQNTLKVYLDGELVYSNSTLNLQMPAPFNIYLEPEISYSGQLLNGTYDDYYTTTDESITVTNTPVLATTVKLVDPSGNVITSASVNSRAAILDIGSYDFPLAASIKAYDSNNNLVASTSNTQNIYGGDVYSAN